MADLKDFEDRFSFEEEWDENTNIVWWDEGRRKLNVYIRAFNEWQLNGFKEEEREPLLARLIMGIQLLGEPNRERASWHEPLERMKEFVVNHGKDDGE